MVNKSAINQYSLHSKTIMWIIMLLISFIVILPLFITMTASFKSAREIASAFPLAFPVDFVLSNYVYVFRNGGFGKAFINSLIVVAGTIFINITFSSMIAFALGRFDFKMKKVYLALFLFGMLIPSVVTETARFSVIKGLGLYNTFGAPILIYAAADMMQIYIYLQFLKNIPVSLDESARIDGASYRKVFWFIIFPLMKPATATIAIIKFVDVMNDMYIPFLYMPSSGLRTLTTSLMSFCGERNSQWNYLSAAIMVVMIPTVVFYNIFQKQIISGIAAGAIKE